jgi:cellulose synthase/poly-beta-1,6-N-acetylglucosamine synthase-like glycosyltransferase
MTILFWSMFAVVVYAYAGFPALLWLRAVIFPRPVRAGDETPRVSVLIAAYNEARHIATRIENLLSQDYPHDRIEIVIASDGSSDATCAIVENFASRGVVLLDLPRQGKGATLNAAAAAAMGKVFVFSDANTHFLPDTLRELVRPLADPSVGGVAGNQMYIRGDRPSATADSERLYWNYDQWLKAQQSRAGSVTSATGAIYAIRSELFDPIPTGAMDDFFISTGVVQRGLRLVFARAALAVEPVAEAGGVEFSRKRRVIIQGLQAVLCRRELLNPLRYGFYSWQLFSHKVLRRLVGIPLLVLAAICPLLWSEGVLFRIATYSEIGLAMLLLSSYLLRGSRWGRWKPALLAQYFIMVNVAALLAVFSIVCGGRVDRWNPERHNAPEGSLSPKMESLVS